MFNTRLVKILVTIGIHFRDLYYLLSFSQGRLCTNVQLTFPAQFVFIPSNILFQHGLKGANFKNGCTKEIYPFGIASSYTWLVHVKYGDLIESNRGSHKKLKGL